MTLLPSSAHCLFLSQRTDPYMSCYGAPRPPPPCPGLPQLPTPYGLPHEQVTPLSSGKTGKRGAGGGRGRATAAATTTTQSEGNNAPKTNARGLQCIGPRAWGGTRGWPLLAARFTSSRPPSAPPQTKKRARDTGSEQVSPRPRWIPRRRGGSRSGPGDSGKPKEGGFCSTTWGEREHRSIAYERGLRGR